MRKKYEGNKVLGLKELIAISLGGMIGGGIFTILGVSVSIIHTLTPIAMVLGSLLALLASYSYIKLGLYYKDKGATYAFLKEVILSLIQHLLLLAGLLFLVI